MPRIMETTVYQFDELSPKAKEKARDWWKELEAQDCDLSVVTDDFIRIAELFGISIKTYSQPWVNTSTGKSGVAQKDSVFWSGFSSQGDGASFEGTYAYKPGFYNAVTTYAPQDGKLRDIAARLLQLQKANGYRISATISLYQGHYVHSGMMDCEIFSANEGVENPRVFTPNAEKEFTDIMRALADWLYRQLESEYVSHFEDEYVDEQITGNEYEFTEDGKFVRR